MCKKICSILFMLIISIFLYSICYADSSSLFRIAETVEMIDNDNVRMVDEDVYIKAYSGFSIVNCEFTFKNETQTEQHVLMGFPASLFSAEAQKEIDESTRLLEFKTFIDGMEKEVLIEKVKEDPEYTYGKIAEWYTWNVIFKPGEVKKVVNTYSTRNYSAPWGRKTGYILTTGAPWKGNIGKATVTFELMDISPVRIDTKSTKPEGYHIDKNKVIWEFNDFEPDTDISLAFVPGPPISHTLSGYSDQEMQFELEPKMWEIHQLMLDGRYEEGLKEINHMMKQGFIYEELYFDLLNYYRKNNDKDMFISVLKEQVEKLNSQNIYEWALSVDPDLMKEAGISYPEDHKPEIKNERLILIDDRHFELSADILDPAGDIMYFNAFAYTELGNNNSLFKARSLRSLLGIREYHYREVGQLPEKFSDMIYRLEVTDGNGSNAVSAEMQGYREGETYHFYTGETLEKWNTRKKQNFTLCYYDEALSKLENELVSELEKAIDKLITSLRINPSKAGYMINFYNPEHFPNLNTETPQNITKAFNHEYYSSELHNARLQNRKSANNNINESEFFEPGGIEITYDWGEILLPADYKSVEKNIDQVLLQIAAKYIGPGWLELDDGISKGFFAVIRGTKGNGKYYNAFLGMDPEEFKEAANHIGQYGNVDKYAQLANLKPGASIKELIERTDYATAIIVAITLIAVACVSYLILRRKKCGKSVYK